MPVFFTQQISGEQAFLEEEESRHVVRVLRLKKNDSLEFVDGLGMRYKSIITDPDPLHTKLQILESHKDQLSREFNLHIGIAPTKSNDRFEWFLEKATEIGVEEITPILCDHSERNRLRYDRLEKILISAMKQSGRACLPRLNQMIPVMEFIDKTDSDLKYIAHCRTTHGNLPKKPLERNLGWCILIGPEGDFSKEEVQLSKEKDFREISLGEAIYRTETAGIIACQLVNFLNQDI